MRSGILRVALLANLLLGSLTQAQEPASPLWAVDPGEPGPNRPVAGRSLFDVVFAPDGEHQIPFPFTVLVDNIATHLAPDQPPLRVLIPMGRSLQREAAAPLYFNYPRVVIAIDGEPKRQPGYADVFLKSLLFLGYQEKANTIEVISYNDEAERFEFQKVLSYGEGMTPRVVYAERAVCTSCHQNGGPIFSKVPWGETDGSWSIAVLVNALRPEYYDQPLLMRGSRSVWAVDYATDRANYFASYQLLWQQGCGHEKPLSEVSVRCRAAVLEAIIKFRLNGAWYVDASTDTFKNEVTDTISSRWEHLWPAGIFIPTADIPNRNPFTETQLVGRLNPVYPREPRAHWSRPAAKILDGMVIRLSEFLSHNDIKRIDDELARLANEKPAPPQQLTGTCVIRVDGPHDTRMVIQCEKNPLGFGLKGWLKTHDGGNKGRLTGISIGGEEEVLGVDLEGVSIDYHPEGRLSVKFAQSRHLNPRRRSGELIESLELTWDDIGPDGTIEADATLTIRADFPLVRTAIDRLVDKTLSGETDVLGLRPFRRRAIMEALYEELGMPALTWCC